MLTFKKIEVSDFDYEGARIHEYYEYEVRFANFRIMLGHESAGTLILFLMNKALIA